MMSQSRAIATAANVATLEAIEASRKQVEAGEAKDPSTVARNLTVAAGISTDKALLLDGRPTQIHGSDNLPALMERMSKLLGTPAIDSTAEEYEPSVPRELEQ